MLVTNPNSIGMQTPLVVARLGLISFINSLPVIWPIQNKLINLPVSLHLANPSELNKSFAQGALDIGAMSSFFYLTSNDLALLPDISISSLGPVGSVLLFSKLELSALKNKIISVTKASATSVNLLKVLFLEKYGFVPNIIACDNPEIDKDGADAVLVIGDAALSQDEQLSKNNVRVDLSAWWVNSFNLPIVFGVWAVKKDFAQKNPSVVNEIAQGMKEAKSLGLGKHFNDVLLYAQKISGFSIERLKKYYLEELDYELGEKHLRGLALYGELAKKHRLF